MRRSICFAFALTGCFDEPATGSTLGTTPDATTSGTGTTTSGTTSSGTSESDASSSSESSTGSIDAVPALDACLAIMDRWWDAKVCPPRKQKAAWCSDGMGGSTFTQGERLDTCNILLDQYAIPETISQTVLDECLSDMELATCWEWRIYAETCAEATCSPACDSTRILEFCYTAGGDACRPSSIDGC